MIRALGFFGCPAVGHHYFDNYWESMASTVGTRKFFPQIIMEHMHPIVGKAPQDEMFHKIESKFEENYLKFNEYMKKNFENDVKKVLAYVE
jgi:hypothetical protein